MQASITLAELFALICYIGAIVTIIGLALTWLDRWLDQDIAVENTVSADVELDVAA